LIARARASVPVADDRQDVMLHVKRRAQVVLILLSGMIADGFFYSAHAQCAATDKIYIDPRLVPRPPNISPQAMTRILLGDLDPALKTRMYQQYLQQGQPIVVPFGSGKVLVHPTDPCIQQYIP
jgi:hypothetical protein